MTFWFMGRCSNLLSHTGQGRNIFILILLIYLFVVVVVVGLPLQLLVIYVKLFPDTWAVDCSSLVHLDDIRSENVFSMFPSMTHPWQLPVTTPCLSHGQGLWMALTFRPVTITVHALRLVVQLKCNGHLYTNVVASESICQRKSVAVPAQKETSVTLGHQTCAV